MKNRLLDILTLVVFVPALLLGLNGAIHLMNTNNDGAVFLGWVLFLTVVCCGVVLVFRYVNKLRRFLVGIGVLAILILCTSCYQMVTPGHVGLLVKQTGSDRGVQDYPIQTGRVWYNPVNENVLEWPTNVQRVIWTAGSNEGHTENEELAFQSKEGLHFTADVNAAYQMERDRIPRFYVQFRTEDMDGFTHGFFRDSVRNALNVSTEYTAEEINGAKQAELINKVQELVTKKMAAYGVDVIQIGFAAPPRPPAQVKNAIESKIAAIQQSEKTEFEKRSAVAEGEKVKAMADAYAEANRVTNSSLTPQLIQWEQTKKWDGHLPQVVGSGGIPMLNLK